MSTRFLLAGTGLLIGVLWMDLLFDVQALGAQEGDLPEVVLASIAAYYRRVTTDASPLGRFVGLGMAGTLAAAVARAMREALPLWRRALPVLLVGAAMALATTRVFPNAVALGARTGSASEQSALARAILHDHLLCLAGMVAVLAIVLPGAGPAALRRPRPASARS